MTATFFLFIFSVLSQIHIFDLPGVATVKFNPKKADLIQELFQKMPTLEQLPSLTEDEDTLKLCKTCKGVVQDM